MTRATVRSAKIRSERAVCDAERREAAWSRSAPEPAASGTLACALRGLRVAQGDLVGLGNVVGLDRSQPLAQALASLPQQLEGIGGWTPRGAAAGSRAPGPGAASGPGRPH